MRKDNVDLICNIAELAGLFQRSSGLENFLQTVVSAVAYHMRAAVCSIYLYDEPSRELVLAATQGLEASSVGRVRLKLGEGLTGLALKELRPIREANGARHPTFKFIPGIREENYRAFLAVPILRGLERVGVLVVQDPVENYFDENDTKALQAIAAQLAATLENAKLLLALHQAEEAARQTVKPPEQQPAAQEDPARRRLEKGTPASPGIAFGQASVLSREVQEAELNGAYKRTLTVEDFERARERAERQLEELQFTLEERLADVASMIFSAHLLIVKDEKFAGAIRQLISAGTPVPEAIVQTVHHYVRLFSESANPRLREKVQDLRDIGRRLLRNLSPEGREQANYAGRIVLAADLLPSDIVKLSAQKAEGLVLVGGGVTAHIAILARSLQLPMVMIDDHSLLRVPDGTPLAIDGQQGFIYVSPSADAVKALRELDENRRALERFEEADARPAATTDGVPVRVMSNINMLSELEAARRLGAEGIGLYRSEFPFIVRSDFPSEEEQFRVYRRLVEGMPGLPIVFRTLDIGGDKMLSYFPSVNESNPFLGLRAIRFTLRHRDIFKRQLRALLRAGHGAELRILFPLVSSVEDFTDAREIVRECAAELAREDVPHNGEPLLGAMIELPSAVEVAEELAAEADFLSIGGNDLVQYMLAVDRTNEHISHLYVAYHPAVLRALKRVADAANRAGKPVSFCGEMAADPKMIPVLIGLGIRVLSVEPRQIPRVRHIIRSLKASEAEERARRILRIGRVREVATALETS